jgi:hypothetical protein
VEKCCNKRRNPERRAGGEEKVLIFILLFIFIFIFYIYFIIGLPGATQLLGVVLDPDISLCIEQVLSKYLLSH